MTNKIILVQFLLGILIYANKKKASKSKGLTPEHASVPLVETSEEIPRGPWADPSAGGGVRTLRIHLLTGTLVDKDL